MDSSPYAPPGAALVDAPEFDHADAEAVRRAHVRHEIQIKAIGALYYFTGVMFIIGAFGMFAATTSGLSHRAIDDAVTLLTVFYVVFGIAALFLGYGFRRLRPWVRIPGGILTALGLLAIPVGTVISAWMLYLMFGTKGQVVLSPDYQDIIAAAPHVKYERTVGDWIATGIVIALLAGMGIMIVLAMR